MSMKAFRVKDAGHSSNLPNYQTEAFLLDSYVAGKQGGTGEKFNWDLADRSEEAWEANFPLRRIDARKCRRRRATSDAIRSRCFERRRSSPGKKDHKRSATLSPPFAKHEPATRCTWPTDDLYIRYHDTEWGVPLHDDQKLFEFLVLEGMQGGSELVLRFEKA